MRAMTLFEKGINSRKRTEFRASTPAQHWATTRNFYICRLKSAANTAVFLPQFLQNDKFLLEKGREAAEIIKYMESYIRLYHPNYHDSLAYSTEQQ